MVVTPEQPIIEAIGEVKWSDIQGRLWKLSEIRLIDDTVTLREKGQANDPYTYYYTAYVSKNEIHGTAAPSTFRVPYTGDSLESLNFGVLQIEVAPSSISFPNLPFVEEDALFYLEHIRKIELIKNQALLLYTQEENENEVTIIFISE